MPVFSLPFYKVSPGGNPTLLVFTAKTGVSAHQYPHIAAKLMRPDQVGAEQVGFVAPSAENSWRLTMMGGEFCGNACRALAAVLHLQEGAPAAGSFSCSGMESPIFYEISRHESGMPLSRIEFPLSPDQFRITELENAMHLVDMPGISHLLLDERLHPQTMDLAWSASILRKRYMLENREAAGVVWYAADCRAGQEIFRITPVVWVKNTNSVHLESACGSGTLALALYMRQSPRQAEKEKSESLAAIRQPSGALFTAGMNADAKNAVISGPVSITAKGTAFVKL